MTHPCGLSDRAQPWQGWPQRDRLVEVEVLGKLGGIRMNRRKLIGLLGATVAYQPFSARAQPTSIPVIGFLNSTAPGPSKPLLAAFHQGLKEGGYVEGQNVAIEYRWAEGQYERLPAMAADLVKRQVALIAATGGLITAQAAMAATSTIPFLFISGFDPVQLGLVTSINRPSGNATGVSLFTTELVAKRVQLARELLPQVKSFALLVNPNNVVSRIEVQEVDALQGKDGIQIKVLNANDNDQIEAAITSAVQEKIGALLVSADPFFTSRRQQIIALAARHGMPATYPWREYATAGGLMSYGPSITDAFRQIGVYASKILKGSKVEELPVQLPTKFDFVINEKTAKALGVNIPTNLIALTNEVIE